MQLRSAFIVDLTRPGRVKFSCLAGPLSRDMTNATSHGAACDAEALRGAEIRHTSLKARSEIVQPGAS